MELKGPQGCVCVHHVLRVLGADARRNFMFISMAYRSRVEVGETKDAWTESANTILDRDLPSVRSLRWTGA
jgi:hypothetical protein